MAIINILIIVIVLSVLVLIHEFGHFIASKKNGVKVEEFGLGYPPRIWGKRIGETLYSINAIPFGGFVKITGEEITNEEDEEEYMKNDQSFVSKTPWQKIVILSAGIFMNLMFAVLLFYLFFFINGFRSFYIPMIFDYKFRFGEEVKYNTVVFDIEKDSPADKAGITAGEAIVRIDGSNLNDYADLKKHLIGKVGKEVTVETMDIKDHTYDNFKSYKIIPIASTNQASGSSTDAILGVYLGDAVALSYNRPLEKVFSGPLHAYNMLAYSTNALGRIISLSIQSRNIEPVSSSVTGPVGVFKVISTILNGHDKKRFLVLIDTVAIISLGFGFTNILPIPALDGGRIAFKLYEWVTKRKVNAKFEDSVHRFGMIVLLILSVLIALKDLKL